ncbi:cell wall hydrolase [Aureimonas sp. AU40]|uniref:cell wall hydrolase n=1 Tax=Aureimonas sp. AU40 TaxID=1637747 RepID=UPI000A60E6D1|nr:cell wall hydrolase [Aureimonas sp. AU40]
MPSSRFVLTSLALGTLAVVGGCASVPRMSSEECLARAMYFESNRSSEEGMLAVGTVVMNRLESGRYPKSVCGVVGQPNQFAPGVLSKSMGKGRDLAAKTARRVLRGERHPRVEKAMFFHTAGYSYPYSNMQYLTIQGGNAFYDKRRGATVTQRMVAEREEAERAGRLPFNPPQRSEAAAQAVQTPAPAIMRPPVQSSRIARQMTVGKAPSLPPPPGRPAGLDSMSIEDLIQENGG